MIQNFIDLAISSKKRDALKILEMGVNAEKAENIIPEFLFPKKITMDKWD